MVGKHGNKVKCLFSHHIAVVAAPSFQEMARLELAGKNLACWWNVRECEKCGVNATGRKERKCPLCGGKIVPGLCHADTLLAVANGWGQWGKK